MVSKMLGIRLQKGERVRLETPGGGGWGAATNRDATARQHDIALGYVHTSTPSSSKVKP
jgi:N-methylhydantoinase B